MTDEKIDGALSVAASQALEAQFNSAALAGRNRLAHTEYPLLLSSLEENCTWFVDINLSSHPRGMSLRMERITSFCKVQVEGVTVAPMLVGAVGRLISLSVLT